MKNAGRTILAMLLLVSSGWGREEFSNAATLPQKTQSEREREVQKLAHQSALAIRTSSRQRSSKAVGQAPRKRREPTGHSSGINFSYHPPQNKSAGSSVSRRH